VFANLLHKGREEEANKMASTLMLLGFVFFGGVSIILFIFAPIFLQLFNLGSGYPPAQMELMTNLMRIIIFGQIIFLIATFFSAILQSHNHFFIPGIAAAEYPPPTFQTSLLLLDDLAPVLFSFQLALRCKNSFDKLSFRGFFKFEVRTLYFSVRFFEGSPQIPVELFVSGKSFQIVENYDVLPVRMCDNMR
jgi:hypothetical protein